MTYDVNQRIKSVRQALELSQREFGEKLGVSRSVLNNIESNVVLAKPLFIDHICAVYGVDPIWLETGEGEMFHKPSVDEELAAFAGSVISGDNPFKKRVFYAMSRMDDAAWDAFERFYNAMREAEEKEKDTE